MHHAVLHENTWHMDERKVRTALAGLCARRPSTAGPSVDVMAKVLVLLSEMDLPDIEPAQIEGKQDELGLAIRRLFADHQDRPARAAERLHGSGLGSRIGAADGRARLQRYATDRPMESWAGKVAGAGEIEERMGIPRSTLSAWRARNAAIGLLRGERKLAYPLDQFVDARPVQGLADVLAFAPDERAAWLWLRQDHPVLGGQTPLAMLKGGSRRAVAEAAERDFGIDRDFAPP